jgi:hypothetical protein
MSATGGNFFTGTVGRGVVDYNCLYVFEISQSVEASADFTSGIVRDNDDCDPPHVSNQPKVDTPVCIFCSLLDLAFRGFEEVFDGSGVFSFGLEVANSVPFACKPSPKSPVTERYEAPKYLSRDDWPEMSAEIIVTGNEP